jgi:hypothetical protein
MPAAIPHGAGVNASLTVDRRGSVGVDDDGAVVAELVAERAGQVRSCQPT